MLFRSNDTATTEIYTTEDTLSLHDALPISAVSLGGPIGFIGIVVPHLIRLMVGADHRLVLPASAFGGAAFVVACDTISRTALAPLEIPVGVVTAIIGGPFFLWLLIRNR